MYNICGSEKELLKKMCVRLPVLYRILSELNPEPAGDNRVNR